MGLIYGIEPDFVAEDARGRLVQLVQGGYCQINCIESVAGAVRGFHYHRFNREAFYIVKGRLDVAVWKVDGRGACDRGSFETAKYGTGGFFGIDSFVAHVFTYLEDAVLISLYDRGVELADGGRDIWKVSEADFLLMKEVCS